jgi:argininosuccinate lyase
MTSHSDPKGARGGRFIVALDPIAAAANASISFDYRLLPHDVAGSQAHARMLAAQKLISDEDCTAICAGLDRVAASLSSGELTWDQTLEDIHMNVEARLINEIGDAGRRLHTARSRNDQVATDLRLYCRAQGAHLVTLIDKLRAVIAKQARTHIDTIMPGYTHLQRAQPVRLAHHLLAYDAMLSRDRSRLIDAAKRADELPLGSGALAATTLDIDRAAVAKSLGFDRLTRNSIDAVADRDFVVELVAACALMQAHLSRLGEEIVLWMSQEFRFAQVGEAYCSGSSLMPQKVNPDIAELVRGKTGRVIGDWVSLMTTIKGLPLAYNKDLQETQEPLYDAVETLTICLSVTAGMVSSLAFDADRMRAAVDDGHLVATEVADYLVSKGAAFRDAHDIAGALVRVAIARGVTLVALPLAVYKEHHVAFADDLWPWLDPEQAINRRNIVGGPARPQVLAELERIEVELTLR